MNNENLKPFDKTNASQAGQKGGIQSAKSRNEKKAMKEHILAILEGKADGKDITRQEELILAQYEKALKGDTNAMKFLADYSDNKPQERVKINLNEQYAEMTTEELTALARKMSIELGIFEEEEIL